MELGEGLIALGRPAEALDPLSEGADIARETGEGDFEAGCWLRTAAAYRLLGRYQGALHHAELVLRARRDSGHLLAQTEALTEMGRVRAALGDPAARTHWREALALLDPDQAPDRVAELTRLLSTTGS
jgi:tetratricopeptide (TPR) repeat protein